MNPLFNPWRHVLALGGLALVSLLGLGILLSRFATLQGQTANELLGMQIMMSLVIFLSPLCMTPVGRKLLLHIEVSRLCDRVYRKPFSWLLLAGLLGLMILGSHLLSQISSYAIGLLPSSWGLSTIDTVEQQLRGVLLPGWGNRLLQFIAICLAPAVLEELFFRGALQRLFVAGYRSRPLVGVLITSIIFGVIHFSLVGLLSRIFISFVMGYVYLKSDRLVFAILLHLFNNLIAWLGLFLSDVY